MTIGSGAFSLTSSLRLSRRYNCAADRFEAEGWEVHRLIPDSEDSFRSGLQLEAIRGDEMVIASYSELGSFDFIARIFACPTLDDDPFGYLVVDEFPAPNS